jgi:hypothetical protein
MACGRRFPDTSFFANANDAVLASAFIGMATTVPSTYLWETRSWAQATAARQSFPTASSSLETPAALPQPYFREEVSAHRALRRRSVPP